LLKYRRHQRDVCRQVLGKVLARDGELAALQEELQRERAGQLDELRHLSEAGTVAVDRSASRRYHAGRLSVEIRQVEFSREQLAQQLALCREALVKADQAVKALEKLEETRREEFLAERERRDGREREEVWLAGRATEGW
jgi:flagellar export protein FliJ